MPSASGFYGRLAELLLFTGLDYWTRILDWTTGLSYFLSVFIYRKKLTFLKSTSS